MRARAPVLESVTPDHPQKWQGITHPSSTVIVPRKPLPAHLIPSPSGVPALPVRAAETYSWSTSPKSAGCFNRFRAPLVTKTRMSSPCLQQSALWLISAPWSYCSSSSQKPHGPRRWTGSPHWDSSAFLDTSGLSELSLNQKHGRKF